MIEGIRKPGGGDIIPLTRSGELFRRSHGVVVFFRNFFLKRRAARNGILDAALLPLSFIFSAVAFARLRISTAAVALDLLFPSDPRHQGERPQYGDSPPAVRPPDPISRMYLGTWSARA